MGKDLSKMTQAELVKHATAQATTIDEHEATIAEHEETIETHEKTISDQASTIDDMSKKMDDLSKSKSADGGVTGEHDGKTYKFTCKGFKLGDKVISAEDASKDADVMKTLVESGSGHLKEVAGVVAKKKVISKKK